jgi:hypothetical protein
VLGKVGADHFDFQDAHHGSRRDGAPRVAHDGQTVHCIGDHDRAEAQVLFGERIRDRVAATAHIARQPVRRAQRLLDGIDAKVDSTKPLVFVSMLAHILNHTRGVDQDMRNV